MIMVQGSRTMELELLVFWVASALVLGSGGARASAGAGPGNDGSGGAAQHISYQELVAAGGDSLQLPGVSGFGPILFDVARDQLFLGARDEVLRVSLRGLRVLQRAGWAATPQRVALCQDKGQGEGACHNYVKVLLTDGRRLFACGTGAFSPLCSWRQLQNISEVLENVDGLAKCPYNPGAAITALMTMEGYYYVGTPTDFAGSDYGIYRALGNSQVLRTSQYNSKWLNEPQFVGSFEDDNFVFFVFREAAVEYINCGKRIYSRIARVCKNDPSGEMMLRDNWTTFVKARLNCSLPGEYPFYYDEVQGMHYLPQQRLLYATFTTPSNGIAGSAICVYNMSAIEEAFRGPFKHQEHPGSAWESRPARHHPHAHCQLSTHRSLELAESSSYQLMDRAVQPSGGQPLHTAQLERYSHISVADPSGTAARLLFVATLEGRVRKLSLLSGAGAEGRDTACLLELWEPRIGDPIPSITSLHYLKETDSVYLGTEDGLARVAAAQCARLGGRSGCLEARDPQCGWDARRERCSPAPPSRPPHSHWLQLPPACPARDSPLDGGWSSWSPWEECTLQGEGEEQEHTEGEDKCQCQSRHCDNPAPRNGGRPCQGVSVRVSNCTVHGGWTVWSGWSACSASCGVAVKWRRRSCAAPAPAHGGRLCVGTDRQEVYCTQNPPCPAPVVPVIEGGWSEWSSWSVCSAQCGGGARWRTRRCDSPAPPPAPAGVPCQGCVTQAEQCNMQACEYRRTSAWTPWVTLHSNNSELGLVEKRFKFSCKAPTADNIKISLTKEEERLAGGGGGGGGGGGSGEQQWGEWGEWGECSVECGGGYQAASRACLRPLCEGTAKMQRACNVHSCIDGWGCWSEWSACSASCGTGQQERGRPCLLPQGCRGEGHQRKQCNTPSCQEMMGWGDWTLWSPCDQEEQHRSRACQLDNGDGECQGPSHETRSCAAEDEDNELYALGARRPAAVLAGARQEGDGGGGAQWAIAGALAGGLALGVVLVLLALVARSRLRPPQHRVPSSPHYITQQNSYVSVPLKEVPKKRQPSFSGLRGPSGAGLVLPKANNLSADRNTSTDRSTAHKLYPKAVAADYEPNTLKRNSNCRNNIDLEQEKFY